MKKYYQYFGLALIMVFSFYYTEKIASIVLNKNPLMQEINAESSNYNVKMINAMIDDEYIIPGLNGLEVNAKESFYNMQELDQFNRYYLVFDQVKPDISLEDHKNKIITKGNSKKKAVSFILSGESSVSNYLKTNHLKASMLMTLNRYEMNNYFENINNETNNFKSLENTLNLNKENKNICVVNDENKEICLKNKKYLVRPTYTLTKTNLVDIKKSLESGNIILVNEDVSLNDFLILLKEVKYKDLNIIYLSEMISEVNAR